MSEERKLPQVVQSADAFRYGRRVIQYTGMWFVNRPSEPPVVKAEPVKDE